MFAMLPFYLAVFFSAITSSLHVTILGFEVYRRLDRLAVRWLSIGQPVMSSHGTLREEVSGVCERIRGGGGVWGSKLIG